MPPITNESVSQAIQLFIVHAKRMENSSFIEQYRAGGGLRKIVKSTNVSVELPDANAITGLVAIIRKFSDSKEILSFSKLRAYLPFLSLGCKIEVSEVLENISARNRSFEISVSADLNTYNVHFPMKDVQELIDEEDYVPLTAAYIFDIFVNGDIIHTDPKKLAIFTQWRQNPDLFNHLQFSFALYCSSLCHFIKHLRICFEIELDGAQRSFPSLSGDSPYSEPI